MIKRKGPNKPPRAGKENSSSANKSKTQVTKGVTRKTSKNRNLLSQNTTGQGIMRSERGSSTTTKSVNFYQAKDVEKQLLPAEDDTAEENLLRSKGRAKTQLKQQENGQEIDVLAASRKMTKSMIGIVGRKVEEPEIIKILIPKESKFGRQSVSSSSTKKHVIEPVLKPRAKSAEAGRCSKAAKTKQRKATLIDFLDTNLAMDFEVSRNKENMELGMGSLGQDKAKKGEIRSGRRTQNVSKFAKEIPQGHIRARSTLRSQAANKTFLLLKKRIDSSASRSHSKEKPKEKSKQCKQRTTPLRSQRIKEIHSLSPAKPVTVTQIIERSFLPQQIPGRLTTFAKERSLNKQSQDQPSESSGAPFQKSQPALENGKKQQLLVTTRSKSKSPDMGRTKKIDRIMKETMRLRKEQGQEFERKEREKQDLIKKRKADIDKVNQRVRQLNQDKVKRRQQTQGSSDLRLKGLSGSLLDSNTQQLLERFHFDQTETHDSLDLSKLLKEKDSLRTKGCKTQLAVIDQRPGKARTGKQRSEERSREILPLQKQGLQTQKLEFNEAEINFGAPRLDRRIREQRRSNGLEFIDVRKEIISEIKSMDPKLKRRKEALKSQQQEIASATQTQSFNALKAPITTDSLLFTGQKGQIPERDSSDSFARMSNKFNEHDFPDNKSQTEQIDMSLAKKEKIRKYIRLRHKQLVIARLKQHKQEINKTKKIHQNLLKLDKVAKKIVTGREKPQFVFHGKLIDLIRPASAFQVHKKIHAKKSEDGHTSEADVHGKQLQRREDSAGPATSPIKYFEVSDNSVNLSQKRPRRINSALGNRDGSKSSVSNSNSRERPDSRALKKMKHVSNLAPCFEISNSAKTLAAQLKSARSDLREDADDKEGKLNNSQARKPKPKKGKKTKIEKKSKKEVVTTTSKPKVKRLGTKLRKEAKPAEEKSEKSFDSQESLTQNSQFNKSITFKNSQNLSISKKHLAPGPAKQFKNEQNEVQLNLKLQKNVAAVVIQKEVRKYLNELGFYEARSSSAEKTQLNIYFDQNRQQDPSGDQVSLSLVERRSPSSKRSSSGKRSSASKTGNRGRSHSSSRGRSRRRSKDMSSESKFYLVKSNENEEEEHVEFIEVTGVLSRSLSSTKKSQTSGEPTPENVRRLSAQLKKHKDGKIQIADLHALESEADQFFQKELGKSPIKEDSAEYLPASNSQPVSSSSNKKRQVKPPTAQTKNAEHGIVDLKSDSDVIAGQVVLSVTSPSSSSAQGKIQHSQLNSIMQTHDYQQLIKLREECLNLRVQKEKKAIKNQLARNQCSPRTYEAKKMSIERWVSVERQEIEKTKDAFKAEWEKTVQMIEDTQKNVEKMRERMISSNQTSVHNGSISSFRSGVDHNILNLDNHQKSIFVEEESQSFRGKKGLVLNESVVRPKHSTEEKEIPQLQDKNNSEEGAFFEQPSAEFIQRLEKSNIDKQLDFDNHTEQSELSASGHFPQSATTNSVPLTGMTTYEGEENLDNVNVIDELKQEVKSASSVKSLSSAELLDEPMQQEPVILSKETVLSVPEEEKPREQVLVTVVTQKPKKRSLACETLVREIRKDDYTKFAVIDTLTDEILLSMLQEEISAPPPRDGRKVVFTSPPLNRLQQDVFVDTQSDREEKREWIELRQRFLIEKDLIRSDTYINEIVDALLTFDIEGISDTEELAKKEEEQNYHVQFLLKLTQPIAKNPLSVLQQMQSQEVGAYLHFETAVEIHKYPIIPVDLYLDVEKAREETLLKRRGAPEPEVQVAWESIHILNKAVFDAVNESLMKFRPYGLTGEPMPWSNKVRRLQTSVDITSVDTERLFLMVKQEVFRWCSTMQGCIPSQVFTFPTRSKGKPELREDLVLETRERKLTAVLASETVEHEHHWLNYEHEEAQVKVDLSDTVLDSLLGEIVLFLLAKSN